MSVERNCPLCGHSRSSRLFAKARLDPARLDEFAYASRKSPEYLHHQLWLCVECDLVYASPLPESGALHEAYESAAYDSQEEAELAAHTYLRALRPMLEGVIDRSGALDIGAGDGAFLLQLKAAGFERLIGVEPSAAPRAAAAEFIRDCLEPGLFTPGRFAATNFSLITCFQTIEHVPSPQELASEAKRLLKPGGAFCVIGHNRRAFSARLLGRRSPIFDVEHLQLFSPASLRRLLVLAGFENVRVQTLWNRYPLRYWTRLFPFPAPLKRWLLAAQAKLGCDRWLITLPAGNLIAWGRVGTSENSAKV